MIFFGTVAAAIAAEQSNPIMAPRSETILYQSEQDFGKCLFQGIGYFFFNQLNRVFHPVNTVWIDFH